MYEEVNCRVPKAFQGRAILRVIPESSAARLLESRARRAMLDSRRGYASLERRR